MKIIINEESGIEETEIIINCKHTDKDIMNILTVLSAFDKKITGVKENQTFILEASEILYIDTADKKTFIYTKNDVYETPLRLYQLEERLSAVDFFRASKSLIINFNEIKSLRPEFGGKLLATMSNGERLYISRQYVNYVKKKLGLI